MRRFTLTYTSKDGNRLTCYNCSESVADDIQRAQSQLGCTDFIRYEQAGHLTQREIDDRRVDEKTVRVKARMV